MSDRETLERFMDDGIWRPKVLEAAIRRLLEENERLRADADRVAAASNVEMADLRTRWNAAEARIDAALAIYDRRITAQDLAELAQRMVKALKGEK